MKNIIKKVQISLKFIDSALPQFRSNYCIVTIKIEVMYHQDISSLNLFYRIGFKTFFFNRKLEHLRPLNSWLSRYCQICYTFSQKVGKNYLETIIV